MNMQLVYLFIVGNGACNDDSGARIKNQVIVGRVNNNDRKLIVCSVLSSSFEHPSKQNQKNDQVIFDDDKIR